ncbi:hypothetical protein FRC04_007538, partial [Tulasnella sp. 424]
FTSLDALLDTFAPTPPSSRAEVDITREKVRLKVLQDVRDLAVILATQAGITWAPGPAHGAQPQGRKTGGCPRRMEEIREPSFAPAEQFKWRGPNPNGDQRGSSCPCQSYRHTRPSRITGPPSRLSLEENATDHQSLSTARIQPHQFVQVVGAVAKIIGYGATRDVLEKFTRGNNPKFAIHFYETLLSASQASENPWVFIAKERPSALDEADWATRPLFHVGEAAFAMFAAEFARCNRVDLAQRVADDMVSLGFTVPDPILNILLDGYAKGRDFTAAGRIYALLTEGEKTPDVFAHTNLINALFQEGAVDDAMAVFRKAETLFGGEGKEKGKGSLHVATYNAVVHGLLINGRAPDAEPIVDHIRNSTSGPKPDTITYNHLLRHYARKSDATNFVRTLQHLTSSGLEPDAYTYTTIVDTLLQSNRPKAVTRMLDVMEAAKIPANTATYTAIDCLIRRKGERNVRAAL